MAITKINKPDNLFNRKFVNQYKRLPYITGYFYVFFDVPGQAFKDSWCTQEEAQQILTACCIGLTPPSGTLNKTTFEGLGGIKYSAPSNSDYTDSVSVKFSEQSGLPVFKVISQWVNYIRNGLTGVSDAESYTVDSYAGNIWYATTKPNGTEIEYAALYNEVFPMKDPMDLYASDIATFDRVQVDIEFNLNMIYDTVTKNKGKDAWVATSIEQKMNYAQTIQGIKTGPSNDGQLPTQPGSQSGN